MNDFLGTRISDYEIEDAKKEFRRKRKHYDEYDFYVYYKDLLSLERKKRRRKELRKVERENQELEEEEFKPCNYISSIYKRNKIKQKNIYDYIDKNDNIYEDLMIHNSFLEKENKEDDISFSFFNESISYSLLRNHNYIDGIPIGVNIENYNLMKKYMIRKSSSIDQSNELNVFGKDYKTGITEEKPMHEINEKSQRDAMQPELPQIFEYMKIQFAEEMKEYSTNVKDRENPYIKLLSYKNKLISQKIEEQKEFTRRINKLFFSKPALLDLYCSKETLYQKRHTEYDYEGEDSDLVEVDTQFFDIKKRIDQTKVPNFIKEDFLKTYEYRNQLFFIRFYKLFKQKDTSPIHDKIGVSEEIKQLYKNYVKLVYGKEKQLNVSELLDLYVPKKKWVQSNITLTNQSSNEEFDSIKKEICLLNNNLKKKNRFSLFCKMMEGNMTIKNPDIFNVEEKKYFTELMNKVKKYNNDDSLKELVNDSLDTDFKIQPYEFSNLLLEKLNLLEKNKDTIHIDTNNEEEEKKDPIVEMKFLQIPSFIYETIFHL